jgi:hypothetical protein
MEKGAVMSTITIPRSGVTTEEVSEVLRRGLGPRYNVLPGKGMNWNPVGNPRADQPGKILVGTGSTWLFRAQVTVSRDRYVIEQTIANFKTWRIMHTDYRRPLATFTTTISTVIALHFYAAS